MEVQRTPPDVSVLTKSLRPLVTRGLPVDPDLDDMALLGLRGVVARSIEPDSRLSRVKALDELLRRLLAHYPDDQLADSARALFGLAPGSRGLPIGKRRSLAAKAAAYEEEHFRKRIEPKVLRQLAWDLHRDSQNYVPRERETPPPLEISGDTPYISFDDVTAKDKSEHEEALSRLWAHVYALRAEILRVERLKIWAHDESEPDLSRQEWQEAVAARDGEVRKVSQLVEAYIQRYGEAIRHGEGEFSARSLLRLAGWVGD